MADTSAITIQQAFQTPFVKGVVSQFPTPDNAFQRFYGSMTNRTFTPVRVFGWDQFNKTRTVATMTAPMTDANVIRRQKIGTKTGALLRMAEKLQIFDEEIANLRPPGAPIGTLDARGEQWALRQIDFMTQRHRNLMELALVKAFLGGFGLAQTGQVQRITELNASGNSFDIDQGIPASHKDQLALDDDGSNLIDKSWEDPSADLVSFFFGLKRAAIRETGFDPKHVWISGKTAGYLMQNIGLQSIAGSANRVWNTVTGQPAQVDPASRNLGGYSIKFNAVPWLDFHVNDAVVSLGDSTDPQGTDATTVAGTTRILPINRAIITPDPSPEWFTVYEGQEPVQEQVNSSPTAARGFHSWSRRMQNALAPSREAYMLDNFLPVLVIPNAIYCPTVVF